MDEPRAQRTLVKSPPELWAEISDVDALAGHLGEFGEIRITRAEPETTVAWEGDRARGTVELEPTAWGTKVTLTAEVADAEEVEEPLATGDERPVEPEHVAEPEPEPEPVAEPAAPAPRRGFFARLFGRGQVRLSAGPPGPAPAPPPAATAHTAEVTTALPVEPEPPQPARSPPAAAVADAPAARLRPERAQEILSAVLDDLGSAHHRPFSR